MDKLEGVARGEGLTKGLMVENKQWVCLVKKLKGDIVGGNGGEVENMLQNKVYDP